MGEFEGKVVLVTGAGRPVGRAIALAFAQQGAAVAANDLAPDGLTKTVELIEAGGGSAGSFPADVASKRQIQAMIESIREEWGRIDILINSAGVEPRGSLLSFEEWDWDRTLAVNLKGPFLLTQSIGRVMAEEGGGVIVNIAVVGDRSKGEAFRAAYVASKMGLLGLTREAARELGEHGIRVNAVSTGPVRPMDQEASVDGRSPAGTRHPGGPADPEGVAAVALFLSSDRARHLSGQVLDVDSSKVIK